MRTVILLLILSYIRSTLGADLPDPRLTPGALDPSVSQANIHRTICVRGYTRQVRPPQNYTNALKKKQIRAYGYIDRNPRHYEEDHLIPLNVGGNPQDPRNLWPEPRMSEWNADKKDELEFRLYQLVCADKVPLAEAQRTFSENWITGYKKYVQGQ